MSPKDRKTAAPGPARLVDVAAAAGVDVSTASRVLNDDPHGRVRGETRERILTVARELDYRPNHSARNLRGRATGLFGMIIPDFAHPTYATLIRGALQESRNAGKTLLIAEMQDEEIAPAYQQLVKDHRIDGLLLGTLRDDSELADQLRKDAVPVVFFNRRVPGGPSVSVDDSAGAALAAEQMARYGHRRLGLIAGPEDIDTSARRRSGFIEAAARLGLPPVKIAEGDVSAAGGSSALFRLMDDPESPTAVFASDLLSGIGALAAAASRGITVPRELSIVVFDDAEIADYTVPALSRIRMPIDEMGAAAVTALTDLLAGRPVADHVVQTPPVFVAGASLATVA